MAEDKKPPKLPPKSSKSGSSMPAQPQRKAPAAKSNVESAPKKLPPKQLPANNGEAIKPKAGPSTSKAPPKSTSNPTRRQPPKLNQHKSQPKPDSSTKRPSIAPSKPSQAQASKSKPTPTQSSSSVPKSGAQKTAEAPRKSSTAPKPAPAQNGPTGKRPGIAPKDSSASIPKQGGPDGKPTARKPSMAPRKPSTQPGVETKRPSITPTKSNAQMPHDAVDKSKQVARKPSLAPRKPSVQRGTESSKAPAKQLQNDGAIDDTPAHRLHEENRDLKDILSESQCADLTILIANITERMRHTIERTFDAKAGLKLINQAKEGEDSFANIDYDPATVDVGAYDKERKVQAEQEKELSKPRVQELKTASLKWFDEWRQIVIARVGEVVNSKKIAEKQNDDIALDQTNETALEPQQRSQKISATGQGGEYASPKLDDLFPRVRTPLTKLSMAQRVLVLHSVFLLLLSLEHYNAASRVLLLYLTSSLKIGLNSLRQDEEETAQGLLEAAKQMTAEQEAGKKKQESAESRKWKIRLASAAGAAIIGYTGGLAAPMVAAGVGSVMGELGLGATTAASYLGAVAGNTTIVGTLFGAYGGRMTGQIMSNISAEVEDFAFLPVHGERKDVGESLDAATDKRRLRVIVAISGWLLEKEEVVSPWRVLKPNAEVFALRFELEALMNLGQSFDTMLSSAAYGYAQSALAKRTVFSELMSAMWPIALVKVARVVDNPFSLAKTRADKAGEVLAEALMNRAQGERPVTLIGYSLGARVIWSCLTTLAKKRGFGFVESAVMMGSPLPSDIETWRQMRTAVTGRLVNVYSENDYLLAFLYRSASLQYGVAGLMPVSGLSGVENLDVSEMVSGHLRYRYLIGSILDKIRFEDVDKDEIAKEVKAFEAVVEEEKKNTYEKQIRDSAGNIYDQYGDRLGLPKQGRKYMPQKEKEMSDDQANKEASKMEKQIHDKTQKGLMQWAVEQLYISPPSAPSADDAKKTASDPKTTAGKAGKDVKKTGDAATKSLYERAMEATYLKRSGGPQGEAAAKDKAAQAKKTANSAGSGSYLSSAANYIPSGYLPNFGGSAQSTPEKAPKKLGQQPKRPSTLGKTQSKSRGSMPQLKGAESTQKKAGEAGKNAQKKGSDVTEDLQSKASSTGKDVQKKASAKSKDAQDKIGNVGKGSRVKTGNAPENAQKETDGAGKNTKRNLDKLSESAQKAAHDAAENPFDTAEKGWEAAKHGKQQVDEFTKTAADAKKTAEGYTSYIPSLGMGKSKEKPEDKSKDPMEDSKTPSKKNGEESQDSPYTQAQQNLPKEKPQESSSYTSYIPSFGFGGSSGEKSAESKDEKPAEGQEKKDDADNKSDDKPTRKDEPKNAKLSKSEGDSKDETSPKNEPQAKDNPPKKKYPWETAMEQGQDVEPTKANDPSMQELSSYNPASYMPSFGWGGSLDDKGRQGEKKASEGKGDDSKPTKSPKGGLMSDSDIYPEDSISSPEKARRRPRSKQPKERKDEITDNPEDEKPEENKDEKGDDEAEKQTGDPSNEGEQPKKKYPWEIAMEEGRDVQAEQEAKNSGVSSFLPSFGGSGGWGGS